MRQSRILSLLIIVNVCASWVIVLKLFDRNWYVSTFCGYCIHIGCTLRDNSLYFTLFSVLLLLDLFVLVFSVFNEIVIYLLKKKLLMFF